MGMLAATERDWGLGIRDSYHPNQSPIPNPLSPVLLFTGCVMDGLFSHVHAATIRTLRVNGCGTTVPAGQVCCGALHAHAGLVGEARELARRNVEAFGDGDEPIVVNSAGCGALLKDYGHLIPDDPRAARFAARVKDVTEVLADAGPVPATHPELAVAYDPPCHLIHAQRVSDAPLQVLRQISGVTVILARDAEKCCGSAGMYTVTEPGLSKDVFAVKVDGLLDASPDLVVTGNPGCIMQIGAGLAARRVPTPVRHPVEVLDDAYAFSGRYGCSRSWSRPPTVSRWASIISSRSRPPSPRSCSSCTVRSPVTPSGCGASRHSSPTTGSTFGSPTSAAMASRSAKRHPGAGGSTTSSSATPRR